MIRPYWVNHSLHYPHYRLGLFVRMSKSLLLASSLLLNTLACADAYNPAEGCCAQKQGIQYCDGSAGRYVCRDGDYSSCYCNRHAVMELQKLEGCCSWQGGVLTRDHHTGLVICNNGGISEMCSLHKPQKVISLW